jgi:DNA-binding transcriptional ArsR family regulator
VSRRIADISDPRLVRALSHPLRVRILAVLEERVASPRELARLLDVELGVVAYHVRTLHALGLLELERETRVRGAIQHHYRATRRPRISDEAWTAAPPVTKQAVLSATLDQIHDYASASAAAGGFDRANAHLTRSALRLDGPGYERLAQALMRLLGEVADIEADIQERHGDEEAEGVLQDIGLVIMLFEARPFSGRRTAEPPAAEEPEGGGSG